MSVHNEEKTMKHLTKHTPGPWKITGEEDARGSGHIIGRSGESVASVGTYLPGSVFDANASLIAASPETAAERDRLMESNLSLLGALKGLRCIMSENHCTCDDCLASKASALAAIQEAERRI